MKKHNSKDLENERIIEELSEKYGLEEYKIRYILKKYKSIDNFTNSYRNGKLDKKDIEILKHNLRMAIDLDGNNNKNLDLLYIKVLGENPADNIQKLIYTYHGNNLIQAVQEFDKRSKDIIIKYFGLKNGNPMILSQLAEEYNMSKNGISQIINTICKKIRFSSKLSRIEQSYIDFSKDAKSTDMFFESQAMFYRDKKINIRDIQLERYLNRYLTKINSVKLSEKTKEKFAFEGFDTIEDLNDNTKASLNNIGINGYQLYELMEQLKILGIKNKELEFTTEELEEYKKER